MRRLIRRLKYRWRWGAGAFHGEATRRMYILSTTAEQRLADETQLERQSAADRRVFLNFLTLAAIVCFIIAAVSTIALFWG